MKDDYQQLLQKVQIPKPDKNLADAIIKAAIDSKQQHVKNNTDFNGFLKLGFASLLILAITFTFLIQNKNQENITTPVEIVSDFYIYELPSEDELDNTEFESYMLSMVEIT